IKEGTATYLTGEKIVIATGAEPVDLPINGKENLITSDEFLELETMTRKIIIIGGGDDSYELTHVIDRVGCEVHILQRSDSVLKQFDADLAQSHLQESENMGVHVHLNAPATEINKSDNAYTVTTKQNHNVVTFTGDLVVHGAGRTPNI